MATFVRTLLSGLLKKPVTLDVPAAPRDIDPIVRGRVEIEIDACIFCGLCARKCPTDAIIVTKAEKRWEIERFRCIVCGSCAEVCPKKCLRMDSELMRAATNRERDVFEVARGAADPEPDPNG